MIFTLDTDPNNEQLTVRQDPPPLVTVAMSDKLCFHCFYATTCSHPVKNTSRSKEVTD